MNFFRKNRLIRRFDEVRFVHGYQTVSYADITLPVDVQTMDRSSSVDTDGAESLQRLKVFCDYPIYVDDEDTKQKADMLWFQGKWFTCKSCRLSENTPLKHYTATFIQCLDQDPPPSEGGWV